jgi:hypothetical protein
MISPKTNFLSLNSSKYVRMLHCYETLNSLLHTVAYQVTAVTFMSDYRGLSTFLED